MSAITLLSSAVLLIGLDQLSKVLVLSRLRAGHASFAWVAFRIVLNVRRNGFLASGRVWLMLWAAEVILLIAVVQLGPFLQDTKAQVALGVAFGGASSNLLDRLWRGG